MRENPQKNADKYQWLFNEQHSFWNFTETLFVVNFYAINPQRARKWEKFFFFINMNNFWT